VRDARRGGQGARVVLPLADLVEEVEHLRAAGVHGPALARHLGTTWPALSRRLARNGRQDLC